MEPEIQEAIQLYLLENFPGCNIKNERISECCDDLCFRVSNNSESYFLRVQTQVVENISANNVIELLQMYSVADTMRLLGDFPVVVTEYGCMFGSP